MSSRGSVAKNGHYMNNEYWTSKVLPHGEEVLEGCGNNHSMPDYSYSPNSVYVINKKGVFHAMRVYGEDHMPIIEIAFHPEPRLNNNDREHSVWHMHVFSKGSLEHSKAENISSKIKQKYRNFLEDVGYDQW